MKNLPIIVVILYLLTSCQKEKINADLLLTNVTIVDVKTGTLKPNKQVAIVGDRISMIMEGEVFASDSTKIIDGSGKYLIPGLWDMHLHYHWNYNFSSPLLIANGIIGIREMFGDIDTIKLIRQQSLNGSFLAPDIFSSGPIIDGFPPLWEGSIGVQNVEEAIAEVDKQIQSGVDFIKIYDSLSKEVYMAIAKHCKENGVAFAGHIPHSVSIWESIEADQKSAEHLYGILEACTNKPGEFSQFSGNSNIDTKIISFLVESFDKTIFDSLAISLAKSNTWITPTLISYQNICNSNDSTLINSLKLEYVPKYLQQIWDSLKPKLEDLESFRREFQLEQSLLGELEKAGVKIIAGTDTPASYCIPGFSLHKELQIMVEGGMSPASTLKAATLNPAIFMEKEEELGSVENGKLASLVLLDKNPLEDIQNTQSISAVFLRGEYLDRNALGNLLEEARIRAKMAKSPFEDSELKNE